MYKRTKGQCKKITSVSNTSKDSMDRIVRLAQRKTQPISLISSPKSRVAELRSIFQAEYPTLEFDAYDARRAPTKPASPEARACTATPAQTTA